jgi:hypothetical protein
MKAVSQIVGQLSNLSSEARARLEFFYGRSGTCPT